MIVEEGETNEQWYTREAKEADEREFQERCKDKKHRREQDEALRKEIEQRRSVINDIFTRMMTTSSETRTR